MQIRRIQIADFGKLHDMELDFSEGFQTITGENGWGKSTMAAFIKAMLYVMEAPDVLFWKMRDAIISPGRVELMVEVWNLQLVERLIVQSAPLAAKKRMIPLHCMI